VGAAGLQGPRDGQQDRCHAGGHAASVTV
jgi:hypothetical protein